MNFKLKPCPFCGEEVKHYTIAYQGPHATELEVACEECNAHICINIPGRYYENNMLYFVGLDAVERWNRRITQKMEDDSSEEKEIKNGRKNEV